MKKYIEQESIKVVGIDLAKSVFHLHGVDRHGRTVALSVRSIIDASQADFRIFQCAFHA